MNRNVLRVKYFLLATVILLLETVGTVLGRLPREQLVEQPDHQAAA
jgi:hypothetical protein